MFANILSNKNLSILLFGISNTNNWSTLWWEWWSTIGIVECPHVSLVNIVVIFLFLDTSEFPRGCGFSQNFPSFIGQRYCGGNVWGVKYPAGHPTFLPLLLLLLLLPTHSANLPYSRIIFRFCADWKSPHTGNHSIQVGVEWPCPFSWSNWFSAFYIIIYFTITITITITIKITITITILIIIINMALSLAANIWRGGCCCCVTAALTQLPPLNTKHLTLNA